MTADAARDKSNVEAVVALSPLQAGILSFSLQAGAADPYFYQKVFRLDGALDRQSLRRAWQAVFDRHPILRADYRWEEVAEPAQIVFKTLPVDCAEIDWRGLADPEKALRAHLAEERRFGFDFRRAATSRLALFRLDEQSWWMVWSFHHIAVDGWSFGIVLRDVLAAYQALAAGTEWSPSPAAGYDDYIRHLAKQPRGTAQAYWRDQLAGFDGPTPILPTAATGRPSFAERRLSLDAEETRRVRQAAAFLGVTVNTLVQGAWGLLLSRHTGQVEVLFGVTVSGRPLDLPGMDEAVGLFINTMPLRLPLAAPHACSAWLKEIQQRNFGLWEHQHLPLSAIQRDQATALFDSIVVFENFPVDAILRSGPAGFAVHEVSPQHFVDGLATTTGRNNYPLSLIAHLDEQMNFALCYDRDRLSDAEAAVWFGQFTALLLRLATEPETPLGAFGLPAPPPPPPVAQSWPDCTVLDSFDRWVRATPTAPAVRDPRTSLDFAELDQRAARLSARLRFGPDQRVGLCCERSVEFVVGMLGILKAGGAYVPLDPQLPAERLRRMAADSAVSVVLASAETLALARSLGAPVLSLDSPTEEAVVAPCPIQPRQLAYVIYTSGSTGQPKGVGISHQALANYVQGMLDRLGPLPESGLAMVSTVAADLGHTVLFGALCAGRPLHLIAAETAADPDRFAAVMAAERIGGLKIVPSHLRGLLQAGRAGDVLPEHLLILGGEACPGDLVETVCRLKPGCRIVNHYGPTEATVGSLTQLVEPGLDAALSLPIGRPLPNISAYVLDPDLNSLPEGVAGELYLGGVGLARGYLNRPGLTAERFVPDPFGPPGGRLYRSGDRVRRRADGAIDFLGRLDGQVKIRGYRVEPGEIETLLCSQPGVGAAAVLAIDGPSGPMLVAYVVGDGAGLDEARLLAGLRQTLPEYMIPGRILVLDRLPLTVNGKLDRKALPVPGQAASPKVEPRDAVETVLLAVWREVLRTGEFGVTDNFFELGGDSILSLQIIARARKQGLKITPRQMFEKQSIAELAPVVQKIETKPRPAASTSVEAVPLTPVLRRFFDMTIAARHHWNQSVLLRTPQPLDPAVLERALAEVVRHHDALRLRCRQDSAGWTLTVAPAENAGLLWVRDAADGAEVERLCDEAQRSLDLEHGPLLRALSLRLADGRGRLLLAVHHLAVDGVSWRVLLEDLRSVYGAALSGRAAALPTATTDFRIWAERLRDHAASPALAAEWSYWQGVLDPAGVVEPPRDHPDGGLQVGLQARAVTRLDCRQTTRLLTEAGAAYRTRIDELLLTALARVLGRWSGGATVLVELEGHGREDMFDGIDLSRTMGWFTSLYPVRLVAAEEWPAAIKAVKEQLRAVPGRGLGYGLLRHLAGADTAGLARPRVTFNYLGQFDRSLGEDGLFAPAPESAGAERDPQGPLGNWLEINGLVHGGELRLDWTYSREVYDAATVAALAAAYQAELEALIGHCVEGNSSGITPSDVPLAGLSQARLDALPVAPAEIADLYPLSPMQQGMLFHSLEAPELYVNQLAVTVEGLDPDRFRAAWEAVTRRHEVLRTGFLFGGELPQPLQLVRREVAPAVKEIDWRDHPAETEALAALMAEERARGFDLAVPPLQRVVLVRLSGGRYRLIWTHHHLLTDGWSSARELGEVLRHSRGEALPPLAGRYRDFIAWLSRRDGAEAEAFWKARLARLEQPTLLAEAVGRRGGQAGHGQLRAVLDGERSGRLRDFARAQRVTLNTLVQAAWLVLLQRCCGQPTVCLGATVAGRPAELAGAEEMLGLFINTLPVIAAPPVAMAVGDWVRSLQDDLLALRDHEQTPLFHIQSWAGQGGRPVFDTLLVFENYPVDRALREGGGGLRWGPVSSVETTNYPLTLTVAVEELLEIRFDFAAERFDAGQVAALQAQLFGLLGAMVADPRRRLGDLSLGDAALRHRLLVDWGSGPCRPPPVQIFHRQVAARAAEAPAAVAVRDGESQISYGELNARANRLARHLRGKGVGPDALVGLALPRSIELMVGLLAILKAGGAYLPLDSDGPAARTAFMLGDAQARLLLTDLPTLERLPQFEVPVCLLDRDWPEIEGHPADELDDDGDPDSLAYAIYTSGSTGTPKGVMITHRGLGNYLAAAVENYPVGAGRVFPFHSPLGFDATVTSLLLPLVLGQTILVVTEGDEAEGLARLVGGAGERIGVLKITPAHLSILNTLLEGRERFGAPEVMVIGGEALPQSLVRHWVDQVPGCRVVNEYGPTETVVGCCLQTVTTATPIQRDGCVPIGRPLANTVLRVLDQALEPVPPGLAGELYIGGAGLARGYLNRPGLTAERFLPDPFGEPGSRLYRTGDLARWRDDGVLEYLGRADHQIKIRGFRIELGEIEAGLLSHPAVREAVAVARETSAGRQLVAYVTGGAETASLAGHLRRHLPEYMIPAHIIGMDSLPLTANGKLDRKALPAPDRQGTGHVAPRNETERRLALIWEEVLGEGPIGVHDDFFARGGHSLLVVKVLSRLQQSFPRSPSLGDLFRFTTLDQLAGHLDSLGEFGPTADVLVQAEAWLDDLEATL